MNRNIQFSKETQDKVKLAKKYIEDKYQTIIEKERTLQQNWQHLIIQMIKHRLNEDQKLLIASKTIQQQSIVKRLTRQSDRLDLYQLHDIIGRGAFGEVRLARSIITSKQYKYKDQLVAIKRLQKQKIVKKRQIYNTYLQRDLMIKNKSKFLIQLKSTFQDNEYLYMVMQYAAGGDLLHLLIQRDTLTQQQTRFYIGETILAIQEIHNMGYIHRDIKPDNILLDRQGHIKISDFGLSKYLQGGNLMKQQELTKINQIRKLNKIKGKNKSYSKVGTPDYISPQVLTAPTYDQSADIWGIGVVMFQCLFGYPPFTHDDSKQVCHRVANWLQYLQFPNDIHASTEAKMLILGIMNDSKVRLSIKQIKTHPFFKGFDWKNIRNTKAPIIPQLHHQADTNNFDKFEQENPWMCRQFTDRKTHQRYRASSIQTPYYSFIAYNYRKLQQENNIFKKAQNTIKNLVKQKKECNIKQKSKQKSRQKSYISVKRIKTELSQKQLQSNILRSKKMRGSVGVGKQNKFTPTLFNQKIKKKVNKQI